MADADPAATRSPATPAPAAKPGDAEPADAAAWAELLTRWAEPEAHRAYLARLSDLDGLAAAGRRYREVLAARPTDAVALAMKAEVLKRATVVGLAMLPRTPPPDPAAGRWRRIAVRVTALWLAGALAFVLWKLLSGSYR